MADTTQSILVGVFTLAASVWVGGYAVVAVVARVAVHTLAPEQRIALFRGVGRSFGVVGGAALAVALGAGAGLLHGRAWDGVLTAITVVAGALVVSVVIGVGQARRMTRLRLGALAAPEDLRLVQRVRRGAHNAALLRAVIGLLTLALVTLGSVLAT